MIKLGAIEFDDRILDALRDDKLVVFAGAGVSMGSPSSLPSFDSLANDIASGTGHAPDTSEPFDRFLGRLQHQRVAVHERAAQRLTSVGSAPNALHYDLLGLFRTVERVKLVTTNFDLHFETAAQSQFGKTPTIYTAPALPLGYDFGGIVHVHGSLSCVKDLILTDIDFGRAYLTEGWARRFLVEVFRHYTVLFVGYRHADVVMNYLARALPPDRVAGRFALTDEYGSWDLLGITPIRFNKSAGDDAFRELYDGMERLAKRATYGVLDWQSRMADIGRRPPPADEELVSEVEQALREVHTTRFLTNIARDVGWPKWMDGRKQLDALFCERELSERDQVLCWWLAEHYAIEHSGEVFDLVAAHGLQLNPLFWISIARELGLNKDKALEASALKRWITILLTGAPAKTEHHALMWLAERCARQGVVHLTLKVFLFMAEHRLKIKHGFVWRDADENPHGHHLDVECPLRTDHWMLNEVWTKHLKPHMASISQLLLSGISRRLEDIYYDLMAWDKASLEWDPISYGRSAIEVHEQNQHSESTDVLVDVARDAIEWLATNSRPLLDAWIETLVTSSIPLLRRLAIHGMTAHPEKSADDLLSWLLLRVGLYGFLEHHEVYRAAGLAYSAASPGIRKAIVDAVLVHQLPATEDWPAEMRSARAHFDWLEWLQLAGPDCVLLRTALAPIKATYPQWKASDHPDLTHWSGTTWTGSQSPWTAEDLLARPPVDQLDDLLKFEGSRFEGPSRAGLIATIKEACTQQPSWALALAEVLVVRALWPSDLWPAVLRGWHEADLTLNDWRTVLSTVGKPELQAAHSHDVANLLYRVVRDGGKPFALDLLDQANGVALTAWHALESNDREEEIKDWLSRAINRPAGVIVEFWINGLSLLMRGKSGNDRTMPNDYRLWFTMVLEDPSLKGGYGRSLLASQLAFLFGLDEGWARQNVVPLFSDLDQQKFAQVWDGFLTWGRLHPTLGDALMPAFLTALVRLGSSLSRQRRRFIEFYTALVVFYVDDPTRQLLPTLLREGSTDDRVGFASQLTYRLRQMEPIATQQLWDRWLFRYWQERLQAVPVVLGQAEISEMLAWLPHLGDSFPAAVSLAVRSPLVQIEYSHLLFELRESELVIRHPTATAKLLIYLSSCVAGYQRSDLGFIANRLPDLPPDVRRRLDERLAEVGVIR